MSGDVQLELWLHEYKLNALATVLAEEDTTVEQQMQDALTELYVKLVPPEVRQEISVRIKEELAAWQKEVEAVQTGQTLADYSAQLMAEDMAPPAQPIM